ncbi:MAG: HD domain-containing response regulator [bacterium]|jgi:response regulator RpfG family c-di-GMP phosphodiesterase|nr:HD domain-containing response regulator [bacterium]
MDSPDTLRASWLIVDDDEATLGLLAAFLDANGARTATARDGREAVAHLADTTVDVVLTDRHMPGLDGDALLREVRAKWPHTDVVMMTGMASVKTAVESMRLGAADYIEKPLDLKTALGIFQRVEERRRLRQERDRLKAEVALRELSQVITANLHMADLPSRIADLITRVFEVPEITILYRTQGEEEDGLFWRSYAAGTEKEMTEGEQMLALEAATQGDLMQRRLAGRWVVCLPLLVDSQPRGSILLGRSTSEREFDLHQLELLRIMASHVGIALENAHLYAVATRQMRSTQKLAEVGRRLNASLDMEETLGEIHAGMGGLVSCDYSVVVLLDRSQDQLLVDIAGLRAPGSELLEALLAAIRTRVQRIPDPAFRYESEQANLRCEAPGLEVATHLEQVAWVSLTDNQGSVGLLGVVRLAGEPILPRELQNIMLLSSSVASALQNSLLYTSMRRMHLETIHVLSKAIDEKDHYTHGHSAQVGAIAVKLGRRHGIQAAEELEEIHLGGLMHDLGKIGIRDSVLNKPGRLSDDEYEHIKTHPLVGAEILRRAPHLRPLIPFVRHHHEQWNGEGYPDGLAGEEIPLKVRILTIADTFHAMASDRIYRQGMAVDQILDYLRANAGVLFDPVLVDQFLDCWRRGIITQDDINLEPDSMQAVG